MNIPARYTSVCAVVLLATAAAFGQSSAAADSVREKRAAASFRSLLDLQARLEKIGSSAERSPSHNRFLKANRHRIVYNEPAAEYLVRSDEFWRLSELYSGLGIADDIAWAAARNPLPGECEGEMICGIHYEQLTVVRYLRRFPAGKHRKAALEQLRRSFAYYTERSGADAAYLPPEDASGRAELRKRLAEIDTVLAKVSGRDAAEVRTLVKRTAARYR